MWTSTQYRRLVKGSAWYDLIVTAAFVTPWSFVALHGVLSSVSQALNLSGELPPFEPMHMLMANLLGSIVCVWAVLRIRDPQQVYGRYDAVGRFLFSTWLLYALLHGASSLLVIFLVFELAWGVAQVLPVRTSSRAGSLTGDPCRPAILS
jgi:magnesium-transporting ATPase (P-type)